MNPVTGGSASFNLSRRNDIVTNPGALDGKYLEIQKADGGWVYLSVVGTASYAFDERQYPRENPYPEYSEGGEAE